MVFPRKRKKKDKLVQPKPRRAIEDEGAKEIAQKIEQELTVREFHPDNIRWALDCWGAYYEAAAPRIHKRGTWVATIEYLAGWFVGDPSLTQAESAAKHEVTTAAVANNLKKVRERFDLQPAVVGKPYVRFSDPRKVSYLEHWAKWEGIRELRRLFPH